MMANAFLWMIGVEVIGFLCGVDLCDFLFISVNVFDLFCVF
jgi:hypothetical protein